MEHDPPPPAMGRHERVAFGILALVGLASLFAFGEALRIMCGVFW